MDSEGDRNKREGGIGVGDVGSGRDTNIQMKGVAGRDNVTNTTNVTNYYGSAGPERKAEAEARPLTVDWPDELPEVGYLPVGSWGVPDPNGLFVGREAELREVARILQEGKTAVITGMGGMGKSQLATMFAYRYGRLFAGGVLWVSMANPDAIETNIALCGGPEGMNLLPQFQALELTEQVGRVRRAWQEGIPRLLIFDNCEEERFLKEFRPKPSGCRVIVTSQRGVWTRGMGVRLVRLEPLPHRESIELLQKYVPNAATAGLGVIADEVKDLPLAVDLAGRFMRNNPKVTPERYLTLWRDQGVLDHPALQGRGVDRVISDHEPHVRKTLALSYEPLTYPDSINRLAKRLLACAAWFLPGEPIPLALIEAAEEQWGEAGEGGENEGERLLQQGEAEKKLAALGLWQEVGEADVQLHQLMAVYVQELTQSQAALPAVEKAVVAAAHQINEAGKPGPLLRWQGHLQTITERAGARGDIEAAALAEVLTDHLFAIGAYEAARPHAEKVLTVRQELLGADHPDTAQSLNDWGIVLRALGKYQEAKPYYEQGLAVRERVLGGEHLDTVQSLNDLAGLLRVMGEYEGARPLYERALRIREQVLGVEHPDTASSLNNLAVLLQDMGDYEGARPLYERALRIYEQVLGAEHPNTASSLNNLGLLLQAMGDYEGARPLLERALRIYEQVLGAEHPDTANSLNNLAGLLHAMGDYEGARPLYERALRIREQVLGAEHPDTASSLNNLAVLLQAMGDYEGARPLYERALRITEQVLGAEHPDTASSLNNLGLLLHAMGDYEGARPLYERALRITEQVLGAEHPDTASSLNNLGLLLHAMGDYEGARPLYERALRITEQVLGAEHPNTASSLNNLGLLLQAMGDYEGARPLYERALRIYEQVLGAEHPNTANSLNNLAVLLHAMGDYEGARPLLERALRIYEQVLGAEHPDTQIVRRNLAYLDAVTKDRPKGEG